MDSITVRYDGLQIGKQDSTGKSKMDTVETTDDYFLEVKPENHPFEVDNDVEDMEASSSSSDDSITSGKEMLNDRESTTTTTKTTTNTTEQDKISSQTCNVSSSGAESPNRGSVKCKFKKEPASAKKVKCSSTCEETKTACRRKPRKNKNKGDDPVYSDIIRCQICGDKASGMHYGVYSCEGCKGFFRRTQRLKIDYKPCPYWGQPDGCIVNIGTRNKCQYCRYQKCIILGMSSTAVRMGRVPKVEVLKLKIELDEKDSVLHETEDERTHRVFVDSIAQQFNDIVCAMTQEDLEKFWKRCSRPFTAHMPSGTYVIEGMQLNKDGPPQEITSRAEMAQQCFVSMEVTIEKFATFAKQLPEFRQLSSSDQLTLFKGAALEVCATLSASRYYHGVYRFPEINTYIRRDVAENSPFGKVTTYTTEMMFYEMFNELGLTDKEKAVFCTFLLYSPDREGLMDREVVERHQEHLAQTLYLEVKKNHPDRSNLYSKLMDVAVALRTLVPDHLERLEQIKLRCNGHLPAEPSPLLNEVYGSIVWLQTDEQTTPNAPEMAGTGESTMST